MVDYPASTAGAVAGLGGWNLSALEDPSARTLEAVGDGRSLKNLIDIVNKLLLCKVGLKSLNGCNAIWWASELVH